MSCPTCGRLEVDLFRIAGEIEKAVAQVKTPLKVAVMGCLVNGPGEAKDADIGISAGNGSAILYVKVKAVEKSPNKNNTSFIRRNKYA